MFFYHRRQRQGVFDYLAVHIQHPEAAVRSVGELDGPEPDVGRSQKLALLVHPVGPKAHPLRLKHLAMHDVGAHIAHERLAAVARVPGVTAVDGDSRGRSEVSGRAASAFHGTGHQSGAAQLGAHHAPRFHGTDAEHFGLGAVGGDARPGRRGGQVGVSGRVAQLVENHLDVVAVGTVELAAPVVEAHPVLRSAAGGFQAMGSRFVGKVAPA